MDRRRVLELAEAIDTDVADRLCFVYELDRLKSVERQTKLADGSRRENSAEHSWHLAMVALTLAPLADEPIDIERVVRMLLVHDVVEIDAGDAFIYDETARAEAEHREQVAADRLFGLAPADVGPELRELWDEYEARGTADARFAYACDRLQPLLLNLAIGGGSWAAHGITADRVRAINGAVVDGSARVWAVMDQVLDDAVRDGSLDPPPD